MHILCPHCRNPIEVVKLSAQEEITCPSCGSSFRLETDTTTGAAGGSLQKLGRFELTGVLGHGAFGTVYKARDAELDRTVAIKVPRAGNLAGAQEMDRFLREARSAAQLRHPSIVTVHEVGQKEGLPYLVSDFVQGVTLTDLLSARRPGFREAAELVAEIADALQYAHEQGVVHRDVKPSNIMIGEDGKPCVMDFGLAKREAGEITMTIEGQVLGTPAYMAPEQARGEGHAVDGRADIYSLGVVLYQLVTGELPFRGTQRMLLHQVLHDEPRPPRSLNDRIPRDLETICLKAMAKEARQRYASAADLAEDLRRFLRGEPIRARPMGAWERAWRWGKRRPAVAALCLVSGVAVLALVGVTVALVYSSQLVESKSRLEDSNQAAAKARDEAESALKQAQFYQYFHHIALAHAGWREGNLLGIDKLLDNCPSGQRHWEWHYLKRLCHAHGMVFTTGKDPAVGLAFSPDGQRLACSGSDQTIRFLDVATRTEIVVLPGHTGIIWDVAFSPDGQRLASAGDDGTMKVWELATEREVFTCQGHSTSVMSAAFSPDGSRLASASHDRTVRLWDARTGQAVGPILHHPERVFRVAFSPDGSQLASAGFDQAVRLWHVATGQLLHTLERSVRAVAFSPDRRLLAAPDPDGKVKVWNVANGLLVHRLTGHRGIVKSVTFSPSGQWLASAGLDQSVRVWDVASGQPVLTLKGHTSEINCVAFHPDGSWLASASSDGTVRAWATTSQEARLLPARGSEVGSLAFSPDGTRLAATARDRTVTTWDVGTGQVTHTFVYPLLGPPSTAGVADHPAITYSPDGSRLAVGATDGTVPVWDTRTGRLLQQSRLHTGGVWGLAYSPDGSRLASAGDDGTVLVQETATGHIIHQLRGHTKPIAGLAFNRNGSQLASCSYDHTVRIWDTTTGHGLEPLRGHDSVVGGITFSPDGTSLASAGDDNYVILWEVATGREIRRHLHASTVYAAVFSPDGQRLASCSEDGMIKVWEVATGLETLTLGGQPGVVNCLSFSPDGKRLASGSYDGTLRIWDARPWKPEAAVEWEALGLLDFLFNKPLGKADVLDYLTKTTSSIPQVRQLAAVLAERYREETDPERYLRASWAVVRQPCLNAFQYWFALRQTETACGLAGGQGPYQTILGLAQYRSAQYPEALASLTQAELLHRAAAAGLALSAAQFLPALTALLQADQLRQVIPVNLASLAMTQHQLGHPEQVRATRARLQQSMTEPACAKDEEAQSFAREVEGLIEGKAAPLK
jgi:WD40 repeat protein/tRNA A-37 threonylcarbamoyl transferase component Bud32